MGVNLKIADTALDAGRVDGDRVADLHPALDEGAGDDGAKALDREDAVNRDAERDVQIFDLGVLVDELKDGGFQLLDAFSGVGGDRDDLSVFQEGSLDLAADILADNLQPVVVHHVLLSDDDDALGDVQQGEDAQMFAGLRHKALVRSNHQQGKVDTARTCQHILDEFFMAGHIDDAGLLAVGQVEVGKAQLDGDAALLFFFDTVGFDAGQRLDQGSLSVVDMAGGTDDNIFHAQSFFFQVMWLFGKGTISGSSRGCSLRCRRSDAPQWCGHPAADGPWRYGR